MNRLLKWCGYLVVIVPIVTFAVICGDFAIERWRSPPVERVQASTIWTTAERFRRRSWSNHQTDADAYWLADTYALELDPTPVDAGWLREQFGPPSPPMELTGTWDWWDVGVIAGKPIRIQSGSEGCVMWRRNHVVSYSPTRGLIRTVQRISAENNADHAVLDQW